MTEPGAGNEAGATNDALGLQSSSRDRDELRLALEAWLSASGLGTRVVSLDIPEHTGVSSLSVLLEVEGGRAAPDRLVARLAPDAEGVPVFPTYDLEKQFLVLDHLARHSAVPVPRVHRLELDVGPLGVPFFVMDRVDGEIPPDILPYPFGSWLTEADRADQRRLQDSALAALASVHRVELPPELEARLAFDRHGRTALHRHVAQVRSYYEWCSADGVRSSVIEEGFSWLQDHWPEAVDDFVLSWGDARIGNMVFCDFAPVALLDWEMVGLAPREVDLGWMIYLHRWFDDITAMMEIEPMRHFMRVPEAVATYEAESGTTMRDMRFFLFYAALHHGIIMFRVSRRQIAFGQSVMPDDPNDLILHRRTLEEMMAGTYWQGFEA
ncbi:MAG TPA: phosphotransferase family protein [Acidimicrobiales bacterium]|nr:phosphotransferase family protein [Acidimicrobiales bacterium]